MYYENVSNNEKVKKIRDKFNDKQSNHLKNVFKNSNILASKQPKNLLRFLSKAKFNTDTNNFIQPKGLFKCTDKHCKICSLYVNQDNSLILSNNMRWELRSHVTCRDINIIYYLKWNICHHKETYIGKTVGHNVVGFKSRINVHISDCRAGISTCRFPIHVYHRATKTKCLKEPYF